jgi:D-3-phosphoglycerate dehydrogenase
MGELLSGKTLGIIGYGRIGRAVADLAQAFGARILAHDLAARSDVGEKVQMVALDELLRDSDIVSLHVPADKPGQYLLDRSAIAAMKKGAYLVNASRGGLVDEQALKEALISGNLAGAGIDVFETEPYSGGLKEQETAVLTSHLGSYARQARIEMEMQAVKNLLKGIGG